MEEEQKKRQGIEMTQVTTQSAPAYKLPDNSIVGLDEYLVWMGNTLLEIKRAVA